MPGWINCGLWFAFTIQGNLLINPNDPTYKLTCRVKGRGGGGTKSQSNCERNCWLRVRLRVV